MNDTTNLGTITMKCVFTLSALLRKVINYINSQIDFSCIDKFDFDSFIPSIIQFREDERNMNKTEISLHSVCTLPY